MKFKSSLITGVIVSVLIVLAVLAINDNLTKPFKSIEDFFIFSAWSIIGGLVIGTCIYFTAKSNGVF